MVKALLGYGARMPKELMLFVKNMVFLDGAIATLAPDLDLFAEIANISMLLRRDPRRAHRRGARHRPRAACEIDLDGVKASFGVDASTERLTYRELQERRELIRKPVPEPPGQLTRRRDRGAARLRAVRLVIARCSVDYAGRLTAHLPEAVRLIMVKADGCVAIHADGGAYKPLNWMNAPNTLVEERRPVGGHQPQGRDAHDHARTRC